MDNNISREPLLDMFIFETCQLLEQLEQSILDSEKKGGFKAYINEIFRIMHTIKGSAAMMFFDNIAELAHSIEDVFYYLREEKPPKINYSKLSDIVLEGIDFIKRETAKLNEGRNTDADPAELIVSIMEFLKKLKNENGKIDEHGNGPSLLQDECNYESKVKKYKAVIFFDDDCGMENVRAFAIIHKLAEIVSEIHYNPENITEDNDSAEAIRKDGFIITFNTCMSSDQVEKLLSQTAFLKTLQLGYLDKAERIDCAEHKKTIDLGKEEYETCDQGTDGEIVKGETVNVLNQGVISVNTSKLDKLMDLVGELVISEAMVTNNPDLKGIQLDNFYKAARQLHKITNELQDIVMSIRMVPLRTTFQKMNRVVRDMSKKLNKDVDLVITGEETEVDKKIIEQISDPLMHLIRNSIDHGIESAEERKEKGKSETGKVILEAKSSGGDVWITVRDDGRGLNKEKILQRAMEHGLINKTENGLSDREIYSFIFLPGFSTKERITEFSGRGVGMDVVAKNIENIGGTVQVDSKIEAGTVVTIKIPLTLAIIDGMTIKVGNSRYTVPMTSIKESMRVGNNDVISDPDGNEMILIRGQCYPILRLHDLYNIKTDVIRIEEGIVMMVENDMKVLCIFADGLIGEQQVVVKPLPQYLKKVRGISGCTLLGDGNISLILDVAGLVYNE